MKKYLFSFCVFILTCCLLASCVSSNREESVTESSADISEQVSEQSDLSEEVSINEVSKNVQTSTAEEASKESSEPLQTLVLPAVDGNVTDEVYRNRNLTTEEVEIFSIIEGYWKTSDDDVWVHFDRWYENTYNKDARQKFYVRSSDRGLGSGLDTDGKITRIYVTGESEITVAAFYPERVTKKAFPRAEYTELYVFDLSRLYSENVIVSDFLGETAEFKRVD